MRAGSRFVSAACSCCGSRTLFRRNRSRIRRGAILDLVARARLRLFLQAADDRLADPRRKRDLRRRRGLHPRGVARALHACLFDALSIEPRALWRAHRVLVGDRVRDFAGCLLLVQSDHYRRAADPVLDDHAIRLGDAGEAAEHALRRPARHGDRAWPACQAGDDLRRSLHCLSCSGKPRRARGAQRRPRHRRGGDRACPVQPQPDLECRVWLPVRAAHRRQYRLAVPLLSSIATCGICRRAVRRVRPDPVRGLAAWRVARAARAARPEQILLLSFALPVLVLILVQAMLSRAHGNWAATAYPAASIFATAVMLELDRLMLFGVSLGLHLLAAVVLAAAPAFARQLPIFERIKFMSAVVGWREASDAVRAKLDAEQYGSILVNSRETASELSYYLRDVPLPLYYWPSSTAPRNHYEMTRPFVEQAPEPVLFVTRKACPPKVGGAFGSFTELGTVSVPIVKDRERVLYFCRLAGYKRG